MFLFVNGRKVIDLSGIHSAAEQYVELDRLGDAPVPIGTQATLQDSKNKNAYRVTLVGAVNNPDGTSSWTYHVEETGLGKDLSHWNLKLDPSHQVVPGTTPGYDFGTDGSTGFFGIKWDVPDSFSSGDFTIVLNGHFAGAMDPAGVIAKGGWQASQPKAMYVPTTNPPMPGLVDGQLVDLHFFFAERNRVGSNFRMETNIEMESAAIPSVTQIYD